MAFCSQVHPAIALGLMFSPRRRIFVREKQKEEVDTHLEDDVLH